ncbi:MAG: polyphosphate kinase 1, partial [Steroidobacteraceae bacterium]
LEHTRVFWFRNDGADDVWLSSADWMDRNFFRRIELCFPVLDQKLKRRVIREGLKPYLEDNFQSWVMDGEGGYKQLTPKRGARSSAQEELLSLLSVVS